MAQRRVYVVLVRLRCLAHRRKRQKAMAGPQQHVLAFLRAARAEQYFVILLQIAAALTLGGLFMTLLLLLRVAALLTVSGRHHVVV